MLGIKDPWVYSAYLLNIVAVSLCIFYGIKNWNKEGEHEKEDIEEEIKWEEKEHKIDEQF